MLRRQARLRREFIYRKSLEERQRKIQEKKERLKQAVEEDRVLDTDLRRRAISLQKSIDWEDGGASLAAVIGTDDVDDEYRWAGVEDPKVVVTTSRDPSARLKMFSKEVRLLFPNAQRMNRGNHDLKELLKACVANDVTDFLMLEEHRGEPSCLVVCHLPYGPTAYFNVSDVVMRHDIPGLGTMSEQYPHLVFHNFKTKLGKRVMSILKYLYPVPKEDSKRVVTFANHDDYVSFRHHNYKKVEGGKDMELTEVGPRFQLRLFKLIQGTLDQEDSANVEWVLRPYMNTARKRRFLSGDDGWNQDSSTHAAPTNTE